MGAPTGKQGADSQQQLCAAMNMSYVVRDGCEVKAIEGEWK